MRSVRCFLLFGICFSSLSACWLFADSAVEEEEKKDTGYTTEEREELMRTIGYVQQ